MIKNLRTVSTLRVLASKKVTDVASHDFRSIEEINLFAKELKNEFSEDTKKFESLKKILAASHSIVTAVTIKQLNTTRRGVDNTTPEFVKPNMDKLNKAFDVVDKYQDKIDSLDTVINVLTMEFKGEKGTSNTMKELKALRAAIKSKLDAAYKFLSDLANNHEPASFKKIVGAVTEKLFKTFSMLYDSTKQTVYMLPDGEDSILISHYIEFKNFQDDNDYIHPSHFIVVSALINTKTLKTVYYVNSLQSFAPPTKAGKGIKVDDASDAALQSLILLEHVGFSSLVDRAPIPTDQGKLNKINWAAPKEWLKSVKLVDHDIVTVTFTQKVNDKNVQDAINHFTVDLKTAIIPNNYRMGIKNRKYKDGKNYVVDYTFTLPDAHQRKEIKLDASKVKRLKDMFDLNDKQAGDLIRHFNNMN